MKQKFDFKDITIIPEVSSSINSRSEINVRDENGNLPIIVSPMDTVIDYDNQGVFMDNHLLVCLPRGVKEIDSNTFFSLSLDEFEWYIEMLPDKVHPRNILVDIANGHMERLHVLSKKFIDVRPTTYHKLMVGNVANPQTFKKLCEIGVDYVRVGIGGGSGCLTSANTGVHYPMASLVHECHLIKKISNHNTKIVADGGFRNYDDIIKAIMLGADYVMLGGLLNQTLESCSETLLFKIIPINYKLSVKIWNKFPFLKKHMYKKFRGMSTKEVQKKWGRDILRTSEGISKYNRVEYKLTSWSENFEDYLKSAMSYTGSRNLNEFRESEFIFITDNSLKRFSK